MNTRIAKELIEKYQAGTATPEEAALIEKWVMLGTVKELDLSDEELTDDFSQIRSKLPLEYEPKRFKLWPRIAGIASRRKFGTSLAAAAAVIGLAVCIYFFTAPGHPDAALSSRVSRDLNDIAPGGNRATLTSNGNTINLSEVQTGLAIDANQLSYNDGTKIDPSGLGMTKDEEMTVSTPRGGMYSIILQDGTKVWLNADSKLEFFSNYRNKAQRIVKLTGEGYFEVAKDKAHPFIVQTAGQNVTVLGTHFNISAYSDDTAIKTTLLEGNVRINNGVVLKPNQQSISTASHIRVKQVDSHEAIDWKNGQFIFASETLGSIMRKVARWYNVEVSYQDNLTEVKFSGTVSRFDNVSILLDMLQTTGRVKFKMEGRKIVVMN